MAKWVVYRDADGDHAVPYVDREAAEAIIDGADSGAAPVEADSAEEAVAMVFGSDASLMGQEFEVVKIQEFGKQVKAPTEQEIIYEDNTVKVEPDNLDSTVEPSEEVWPEDVPVKRKPFVRWPRK